MAVMAIVPGISVVTVVPVVTTVPTTMAVMTSVMLAMMPPVMSSTVSARFGKVRQRCHSDDTGRDSQKHDLFESLHGRFLRC